MRVQFAADGTVLSWPRAQRFVAVGKTKQRVQIASFDDHGEDDHGDDGHDENDGDVGDGGDDGDGDDGGDDDGGHDHG